MKEKVRNNVVRRKGCPKEGFPEMVDRIVREHHPAIRRHIVWLKEVFAKVVQAHDHEHPQIVPVYVQFLHMCEDLERHMLKEESVVFPYLLKAEKDLREGKKPDPSGLGHRGGDNPLQIILWEHEATQKDWAELRALTSDFTAPGDCAYVQAIYWGMKRLEPALASHLDWEVNRLYRRVKDYQWLD